MPQRPFLFSGTVASNLRFGREEATDALDGPTLEIDYTANARSYGCAVFEASSLERLSAALHDARAEQRPVVIVCHVSSSVDGSERPTVKADRTRPAP